MVGVGAGQWLANTFTGQYVHSAFEILELDISSCDKRFGLSTLAYQLKGRTKEQRNNVLWSVSQI